MNTIASMCQFAKLLGAVHRTHYMGDLVVIKITIRIIFVHYPHSYIDIPTHTFRGGWFKLHELDRAMATSSFESFQSNFAYFSYTNK